MASATPMGTRTLACQYCGHTGSAATFIVAAKPCGGYTVCCRRVSACTRRRIAATRARLA